MSEGQDSEVLSNVKEVKAIFSEDKANELLDKGWVLLSVAKGQEQTGPNDYTPVFKYSLGRVG